MTIKQLSYFIAVYQKQSFTKASEHLHISQQAISTSIIDLEKELGYNLFTRKSNKITPTVYGQYLYKRSIDIINDFNNIKLDFDKKFKNKNTLKIVTAPGVLRSIPIECILEFEKKSNTKIIINHYQDIACEEKVKNSEVDLALTINSKDITLLNKTIVQSEPYYIIFSKNHHFKNKKIVKWGDMKNENFACFDENYRIYNNLKYMCNEYGYTPNIIFTSTEGATLAKYALASNCVFLCVKHIVDELRLDNILALPVKTKHSWEIVALTKTEDIGEQDNSENKNDDIKTKFILLLVNHRPVPLPHVNLPLKQHTNSH